MSSRAQPVLTAGQLQLRPWAAADSPVLVAAYADPDIQRWHVRSMSDHEARVWVASRAQRWGQERGADWAVTRDGRVAGRIGLRTVALAEGWAEVSYWVLPAARGAGVATTALQALSRWCVQELGLHRLEVAHSVHNAASCRVAAAAGYALEGTKRSQARHADGWHDMHLHALLADPSPEAP